MELFKLVNGVKNSTFRNFNYFLFVTSSPIYAGLIGTYFKLFGGFPNNG
jgi:hypothetical protein